MNSMWRSFVLPSAVISFISLEKKKSRCPRWWDGVNIRNIFTAFFSLSAREKKSIHHLFTFLHILFFGINFKNIFEYIGMSQHKDTTSSRRFPQQACRTVNLGGKSCVHLSTVQWPLHAAAHCKQEDEKKARNKKPCLLFYFKRFSLNAGCWSRLRLLFLCLGDF